MSEATHESQSAAQRYRSLLEQSDLRLAELRSRDGRFATVRLVLFGSALIVLGFAFFADVGTPIWVLGYSLLGGFLIAAIVNEPVRDAMRSEERHAGVLRQLIARLQRDWKTLESKRTRRQLRSARLPEHARDVADDLDLLGSGSLFQFVSMAATTVGVRTLAEWLTGVAEASIAERRGAAVRRLAPRREQRLRFYQLAADVGGGQGDPDAFAEWAKSDRWLDKHPVLSAWTFIAPVLSVIAFAVLVAYRIGWLETSIGRAALVAVGVIVLINVLITTLMLGPVHQIFATAMASRRSVDEYRELFGAADWLVPPDGEDASGSDRHLNELHDELVGDPEHSARVGMNALQKVAKRGALRSSAATFLLYVPLQAFALWDVHVLRSLERWKTQFGGRAGGWFAAFGELEALMSIAALCDENPSWVFPEWQRGEGERTVFRSAALGHPLIPDDQRVCNDVSIGPPGSVLLVTGSNMSGKSTMLRSVGLNVALAGVGSPVCAASMSLPSTELATSIRVRDNLTEGVSFYMAELHRLKGVVDRARALAEHSDRVSLFLLDEILQGTNSRERQIAVTQVLRHLMECGAIGAISTHDLELADEPQLKSVSDIVHFRETITTDDDGSETMTFDYRMRTGVSPTTNALRLLEIVGLGGQESPSDQGPAESVDVG